MANFSGTPQNVDLFTRWFIEAWNEHDVINTSTVWLPFFGDAATGGKTLFSPNRNAADIDIKKGNDKYAKMRLRGAGNYTTGDNVKGVKNERFSAISRTYPLMEEFGAVSAEQLDFRSFGNSPYMDSTKQGRLRSLARDEMMEMVRRMVRAQNLLAKSSILEGFQPAIFGTTNVDLQYDMYRDAQNTYTVPIAWDNASAVIFENLETGCDRIHKNGHTKPDAFFTRGSVVDAMIQDSEFSAVADNRRFNLIGLGASDKTGANPVSSMPAKYQKFVDSGWMYRGWVQTSTGYELHVFVTPDFVEEDGGTYTDMVDAGYGLLCNSQVRCDRYFGPDEKLPITSMRKAMYEELLGMSLDVSTGGLNIKNASALVRPEMYYFDAYPNESWTNVTIRGQAAPIYVTTHTDAFLTFKGLTT